MGQRSTVKDAFRFAGELGIELNIEHFRTVKTELRNCQVERLEEEVRNQRWQGSLVTATLQDEKVSGSACFWWLTEWKSSPTHTITRMFELWEQLLATRLNVSQCCKYLIIHSPQSFSGIIYNTGWGILPDCLRCSLQVLKE